jgi:hypothetical protein
MPSELKRGRKVNRDELGCRRAPLTHCNDGVGNRGAPVDKQHHTNAKTKDRNIRLQDRVGWQIPAYGIAETPRKLNMAIRAIRPRHWPLFGPSPLKALQFRYRTIAMRTR